MLIGLAVGLLFWLIPDENGSFVLGDLPLILFPGVIAFAIADYRNRRKKVGRFDPELLERNRRGTV